MVYSTRPQKSNHNSKNQQFNKSNRPTKQTRKMDNRKMDNRKMPNRNMPTCNLPTSTSTHKPTNKSTNSPTNMSTVKSTTPPEPTIPPGQTHPTIFIINPSQKVYNHDAFKIKRNRNQPV